MRKNNSIGIDIIIVFLTVYDIIRDALLWAWQNVVSPFFSGVIIGCSIILTILSSPLWISVTLILIVTGHLHIDVDKDKEK